MKISPLASRAYAQLVQFVEPQTRFDASSLTLSSGTTESVDVSARQTTSVTFKAVYQDSAGRVPSDVASVGTSDALTTYVDDCLRQEQERLPARMRFWLEKHANVLGSRLEENDCFGGPHRAGFELECELCRGQGHIHCTSCKGNGRLPCPDCNYIGSGSLVLGRRKALHGDGTVLCMTCKATDAGFIDCTACGGKKVINCQPCKATGWRHRIGNLVAKTSTNLSIRADIDRDEPRSVIESLTGISHLHEWAPLHPSDAGTDATSVYRVFAGTMPVTTLRLKRSRYGVRSHCLWRGRPDSGFQKRHRQTSGGRR